MVPSDGPSRMTRRIRSEPVRRSRRPDTTVDSRPKSGTRPTAAGTRSRERSGASSDGSGASTIAAAGVRRPNGISATVSRRRDALQALSTFRRASVIRPVRSSEARVTRTSFRGGQSKRLPPRASTQPVAVTGSHAHSQRSGMSRRLLLIGSITPTPSSIANSDFQPCRHPPPSTSPGSHHDVTSRTKPATGRRRSQIAPSTTDS